MKKAIIVLLAVVVLMVGIVFVIKSKESEAPSEVGKKLIVAATTIFPVYDIAKAIIGDKGKVMMIVPPGVEAHSYDPTPEEIIKVGKADFLFYMDDTMESWIDKIKGQVTTKTTIVAASENIEKIKSNDDNMGDKHHKEKDKRHDEKVGKNNEEEHHHGEYDPHIWLDPTLVKQMVDNFVVKVVEKDPENKEYYIKNGEVYKNKLNELDKKIADTIAKCKVRTILYGGHYAFGYFSKKYGIDHKSPYENFSPNSEPTPKNIKELIDSAKNLNVKYIYTEELINPKAAEIIAKEAGTKTLVLHGAHNVTKGEIESGITYFDIMNKNIENLKIGLDYSE